MSHSKKNFNIELSKFLKSSGPSFFEIKIKNKSMQNLTRPKNLKNIKRLFQMDNYNFKDFNDLKNLLIKKNLKKYF